MGRRIKCGEGHEVWEALKTVLRNIWLGITVMMSIKRSNCTNEVVWSRDMWYEKC